METSLLLSNTRDALNGIHSMIVVSLFSKVNSKLIYYVKLLAYNNEKENSMLTYMERLRGLWVDNDLTQAQAGNIPGTSQTMYARYERGADEMPNRHLIILCKFYNVSADYLLDTAPDSKRIQKSGVHL